MSDLKLAREALERIARPLDCGCVPCRGQCRSEEALRITVEEMQSEAREALKALSAPEAAPASPSPGAWTEEIKAVRADLAEAEQLAFHRADNLHTHAAICRAIAKLSTLNATPPAPAGLDSREGFDRLKRLVAGEPFAEVYPPPGLVLFHADLIALLSSPPAAGEHVGGVGVGWRLIDNYDEHGAFPVLVGRPAYSADQFGPAAAFKDAGGTWRVYMSEGGMDPLPFTPTHWMPLPAPPAPAQDAEGGE